MQDNILLIFPIIVIGILLYKVKVSPRGMVWQDCWNYSDAKNIQVLAAFGVILHHLAQLISCYDMIPIGPIQIMTSMGILFTSIFFFYSGFGLMQSFENKNNYLDHFLLNRLSVVVIPFLITNIIYIWPGYEQERITSIPELLTSIVGFTLINTNAWYLVEIIIFYIAFYLCFKLIKNSNIATVVYCCFVLVVIIASVLLGHDFSQINGHWFMGEWWFNSSIVFVMGILFGKYRDRIVAFYEKQYIFKMLGSIVLFVLSFHFEEIILHQFGYYNETITNYNYSEKFITLGAQMITCILFMQMILLITMKLRFDNMILKYLSAITLELYLVQDLCMQFFSYESKIPHYLIYIYVIAGSLILAVLVHFIDKFFIKLIKKNS